MDFYGAVNVGLAVVGGVGIVFFIIGTFMRLRDGKNDGKA